MSRAFFRRRQCSEPSIGGVPPPRAPRICSSIRSHSCGGSRGKDWIFPWLMRDETPNESGTLTRQNTTCCKSSTHKTQSNLRSGPHPASSHPLSAGCFAHPLIAGLRDVTLLTSLSLTLAQSPGTFPLHDSGASCVLHKNLDTLATEFRSQHELSFFEAFVTHPVSKTRIPQKSLSLFFQR